MSIFMLILWIAILLLVIADDISSQSHKTESEDLANKLMMAKMIEYLAIVVVILLELENVLG